MKARRTGRCARSSITWSRGAPSTAGRPTSEELRATRVLRVPVHESSAKVRTGPPIEEPADLALPYFGGEVPLTLVRGAPVPDGL